MDLPTLTALHKYWRHSPPVHVLVARYLGVKGPSARSSASQQVDSVDGLINLIKSGEL